MPRMRMPPCPRTWGQSTRRFHYRGRRRAIRRRGSGRLDLVLQRWFEQAAPEKCPHQHTARVVGHHDPPPVPSARSRASLMSRRSRLAALLSSRAACRRTLSHNGAEIRSVVWWPRKAPDSVAVALVIALLAEIRNARDAPTVSAVSGRATGAGFLANRELPRAASNRPPLKGAASNGRFGCLQNGSREVPRTAHARVYSDGMLTSARSSLSVHLSRRTVPACRWCRESRDAACRGALWMRLIVTRTAG